MAADFWVFLNPLTPKISLVILLTVCHTSLASLENYVLDPFLILKLIFLFILITYLIDIVLIL